MKTFNDLEFKKSFNGRGIHATMQFNNNYGLSVIRFNGSYGGNRGLYKVAVLYNEKITYSSPVAYDTIGNQTEDDVSRVMGEIQEL